MFLHLKNLLTAPEVALARQLLLSSHAPWRDGRASAGAQAMQRKNNAQLAQDSDMSHQLQRLVLQAVQRDALFFSAALPRRIFNPLFNRYGGSANHYGAHVDGALMHSRNPDQWVRSDLSCTVFLAEPDDYEGGELIVHGAMQGANAIKLPAGDAILYPASTVHEVAPVTQGARIASFFWIESRVRSGEQRQLLFDMDMHLLQLRSALGEDHAAVVGLTGTYHNLLRLWADA